MKRAKFIIGAFGLTAAFSAGTAQASAQNPSGLSQAEAIRKLDIMLMVTSLRCRNGAHDFRDEYHQFAAVHLSRLNAAERELRGSLVARYGRKGSNRAVDRMGVSMANAYGGGHPWLDCAELKQTARELSGVKDSRQLSVEASRLLSSVQPASAPVVRADDVQIAYDLDNSRSLVAAHSE